MNSGSWVIVLGDRLPQLIDYHPPCGVVITNEVRHSDV